MLDGARVGSVICVALLDGGYGDGVFVEGAVDGDGLAGEVGDLRLVGNVVDLVAYDENGLLSALDALGGAFGVIGLGGLGGVAGAHGVGDDALEGFGEGAG